MTKFVSLKTEDVRKLQNGGLDANGQKPEITVSNGAGNPCRHCLESIDEGEEMLVLAHRPFGEVQPYAEMGPIFLHAKQCSGYSTANEGDIPSVLKSSSHYLLRGYDDKERIVYGTGGVIAHEEISSRAQTLFANNKVKFIHVRSASNNCYQARIDRD